MACRSDSAGPTWTKIGTVKQLDPGNKPLAAFLQNLQIDPTPEGQSSKFDLIWTRNHVLREKKFFLCVEAIFFNFFLKKKFLLGGGVGGGKKKFWGQKFFFNFFFLNTIFF